MGVFFFTLIVLFKKYCIKVFILVTELFGALFAFMPHLPHPSVSSPKTEDLRHQMLLRDTRGTSSSNQVLPRPPIAGGRGNPLSTFSCDSFQSFFCKIECVILFLIERVLIPPPLPKTQPVLRSEMHFAFFFFTEPYDLQTLLYQSISTSSFFLSRVESSRVCLSQR